MEFCDTHIHLPAFALGEVLSHQLTTAALLGVRRLIQPGVSPKSWPRQLALSVENPGVYCALGLHPRMADQWDLTLEAELCRLIKHPRVVAVGEIGLDARVEVSAAVQKKALRAQLAIAISAGLPVIFHSVKGLADLLEIGAEEGIADVGGVVHGFSGSPELATRVLNLGLHLGIGPVLLRTNARKLPQALVHVPASALVLETDAPDMAPGVESLRQVAQKLAELRGWSLAECARITSENACRLFKFSGPEDIQGKG